MNAYTRNSRVRKAGLSFLVSRIRMKTAINPHTPAANKCFSWKPAVTCYFYEQMPLYGKSSDAKWMLPVLAYNSYSYNLINSHSNRNSNNSSDAAAFFFLSLCHQHYSVSHTDWLRPKAPTSSAGNGLNENDDVVTNRIRGLTVHQTEFQHVFVGLWCV